MKKICDVLGPRLEESKLCPIVLTSKANLEYVLVRFRSRFGEKKRREVSA